MPLQTIQNDVWKLDVSPETGASIAGLYAKIAGSWQPVLRETSPEAIEAGNPSSFSSFTLAPFSNRIENAKFAFQGETYELRATTDDGNTQHGDVRGRPWRRVHADAYALEYMLTTKAFEDFNFPFPFIITTTYRLERNTFAQAIRLKNIGERVMPAGFGIHPYFNRSLAGSSELELSFNAAVHYELDDDSLPTGKLMRPKGETDFAESRALGEQKVNDLYRGWIDPVTLTWPDVARLKLHADPIFEHLIVFTHADGSLAVEPVTNANDGFNLLAQGETGSGVQILEPGESLHGSIKFKLELL